MCQHDTAIQIYEHVAAPLFNKKLILLSDYGKVKTHKVAIEKSNLFYFFIFLLTIALFMIVVFLL
jgi:hypothetical protein